MFEDCPYKYLLFQTHTWEEKVVRILHVVRRREFTERNPKTAEVVHGLLFRDIPSFHYERLDTSFNVISIKVAESDIRYPINIYGTVLARDKNDYRCVYLFKRGRDEPQVITRKSLCRTVC